MRLGTLIGRNVSGKKVESIILQNANGAKITLEMKTVDQMVEDLGLKKTGNVQQFHTKNVLHRIKRYMPYRTGVTYKVTVIQTDIRKPEIVTDTPYAKYLFHGKVMIDPKLGIAGFMTPEGWRSRKGCVKVLTDRDLKYFRGKNPQAGPRWDRALSANEGKAMAADLQNFIDRRSK